MPFGACSLWPDSESMSMWVFLRSIGSLPTACTASVWNITPASWAISAICSTGKIVPVSLLAHMKEAIATFGESLARYASRSMRPWPSTPMRWTV